MVNETIKQRNQRRMKLGFNNPKKDFWARRGKRIPMMPRLEPIVQKLKWWQRIYVFLIIGFKRLWRRLLGKQK